MLGVSVAGHVSHHLPLFALVRVQQQVRRADKKYFASMTAFSLGATALHFVLKCAVSIQTTIHTTKKETITRRGRSLSTGQPLRSRAHAKALAYVAALYAVHTDEGHPKNFSPSATLREQVFEPTLKFSSHRRSTFS